MVVAVYSVKKHKPFLQGMEMNTFLYINWESHHNHQNNSVSIISYMNHLLCMTIAEQIHNNLTILWYWFLYLVFIIPNLFRFLFFLFLTGVVGWDLGTVDTVSVGTTGSSYFFGDESWKTNKNKQ